MGTLAMNEEMAHDAFQMVEYGDSPAVHLFADSAPALARMRRTAETADCRILRSILIQSDPDAFRACTTNAPALIEIDGGGPEEALIALLDWAQGEAESGARRSVVAAPPALIDLVAARTPHAEIIHLCAASDFERVIAVARVSRVTRARLNDIGRGDGSLILQQLSQEVGRIAATLAQLSEDDAAAMVAVKPVADEATEGPGVDAATIRSMIRARRLRDQYFRGDLFADPAWDMLLDLMAARLEKNRVAVSSLCIAAAVPATTALRWIKALTDSGLFVRSADPRDGRRVYIELSDDTARALAAYLRAVQRPSQTGV
jgi:DNA-binding transcriptional ArsR family regulator